MSVRSATGHDKGTLIALRKELWPDEVDEHNDELTRFFEGQLSHIDHIVVAESESGEIIGFAELRVRNYAEGSNNFEVPFLEGWYVTPSHRRNGIGRALIGEAEAWARRGRYSELASDVLISNSEAICAHASIGFKEVERTVSFLKNIE